MDSRTFGAVPPIANGTHTIDGYVFLGMPYYYDPESMWANPGKPDKWKVAPISAVDTWLKLLADPNYASLPPVTSISVDIEVSGTVEEPVREPDSPIDAEEGTIIL